MQTKGGRITIDFGSTRVSARGEVSIMPNRVTPENGVNQDGTGFTTIKPRLARAEMSFDRGIRITDDMLLQSMNVTIRETDTGITHLFTNARLSGDQTLNTVSGEVSGLAVESDSYQQV